MLCYWILKRNDGKPVGLVKMQNDRVMLHLTAEISGTFTLFSATDAVPIVPESETRLCGAEALLGMENGETVCFAAAVRGASPVRYQKRLSQIYTKQEEPPLPPVPVPEPEPEQTQNSTIETKESSPKEEIADDQSQLNTIKADEPDSVSDTARETESFSLLLNRAETFYAAYEDVEDMVQKEDMEEQGIDLFPQTFPGARWRYVDGTDVLPHYEGIWTQPGGTSVKILAVRGRAAPRPPRTLYGFSRYLRDRDGAGYWIRIVPTDR